MKSTFAILLAFFVTWSALQPCRDGLVPEQDIQESCSMVMEDAKAHHCCSKEVPIQEKEEGCGDNHGEEGCNGFCFCQCCGTVFLHLLPEQRTIEWSPAVRSELAYLPEIGRDFPQLIWQPPPIGLDA